MKLATASGLRHPGYPICDACDVEVVLDDGWLCPSCGTSWPAELLECDGDQGTLYPDWSGEELTGPVCPPDLAWRWAHLPPDERDARIIAWADA